MGENVDSDLLYEDFQNEEQKEFNNENYGQEDDLYDDVLTSGSNNINNSENNAPTEHNTETETNGYQGNVHSIARRFQLYVGNLTWWTTDQDITDAVIGTGVSDFQEVKFFENRANGQSKGFCVITLGSESSMRIVLENLPKKDLNGQAPVVTLPTKQALNQFESQQKTRPTPPVPPNQQKSGGNMGNAGPNMMMNSNMPPQMHPRMMNPNVMRGPMPMQNPPMMNPQMQQRMPGNGPPPMNHPPHQMPPRFQNNWNNAPPRPPPNAMPGNRPPMNMNPQGAPMPMMNRAPMNMNMGPNRPGFGPNRPMHPGNFNQGQQNMNMPPRGPMPPMNSNQVPAPHVNPAFFNNQPVQNIGPPGNPHFNQQGPRPMWPGGGNKMPVFDNQAPNPGNSGVPSQQPPISEPEFEEIMGRNRTVSSSAVARAVSDAAAGEYTSAIETLATAISLIKQSKVASDERCKILITSLQDTLQGIEAKSFNRRDRSDRSRSRERRRRRDRSNSRSYRRSRSREHRDHRDRGRDDRYYGENYHSSRDTRERSRSRDRGNAEHYRGGDESNSRSRPRKSAEPSGENSDNFKRSYEERNRDSDRYRERETRNRH